MRFISKQNYAAVTGTLALVVAMTGTGYAAATVAKNSVGTDQIINGSIRTEDLHDNAVTGGKTKNDTLTGKDIREGSLKTVPNAAKVGSQTVIKISYHRVAPTDVQTIYSQGGLTLDAQCYGPGNIALTASNSKNNAALVVYGVNDDGTPVVRETDFEHSSGGGWDAGDPDVDMLAGDDADLFAITFNYNAPDATVITGNLVLDETATDCWVTGHVIAG
jgi:hypothetical protein